MNPPNNPEPLSKETQDAIKSAVAKEGFYFASDTKKQDGLVMLLSMGGKIFTLKIDSELDPTRFYNSVRFHGPLPPPVSMLGHTRN